MARKYKKNVKIAMGIILFLVTYLICLKIFGNMLDNNELNNNTSTTETQRESTNSLRSQLNYKKNIYMSSENADSIKIESVHWDEVRIIFNQFPSIREVDKFNPIYKGHSDDGIRFETDLDYFRIYTVSKEEFYKVPVTDKEKLESILNESIYTSLGFVKQYKTWNKVQITDGNKTRTLSKWKFDELSYKLISKRIVGKVQPEKNKEKSEYNFVVNIEGDNYTATIETMGEDYVKISSEKGEAYYEVSTILFNYLKEDVFNIK